MPLRPFSRPCRQSPVRLMRRRSRASPAILAKCLARIITARGTRTAYHTIDKGPTTLDDYLQKLCLDHTNTRHAIGYVDSGWTRPTRIPTKEELTDVDRRLHRFGDLTFEVPDACELRDISTTDLRKYLRLNTGGDAYSKYSPKHGRARMISGCVRHSGSLVPEEGQRPSQHNGLDCRMDSGTWFILDEFLDKVNRHVFAHHGSRTRTAMTVKEIAELASSGADDLTKIPWHRLVVPVADCRRRCLPMHRA